MRCYRAASPSVTRSSCRVGTQFLCTGAARGERCLLVAFEEAPEQLFAMARGFGWDLQEMQQRGVLRIVYVPQGDIRLLNHLARIVSAVEEFRPTRVVIDSFSVYLYRVNDPATQRDMTYRLCSLIRGVGAVGLLVSDITAANPGNVSRFGVEETVADGTIVLTSSSGAFGRRRYLEIHKMRDCRHVIGRQRMTLGKKGVRVLYEQAPSPPETEPLPLVSPVLAGIARGELHHGFAWLVRGDAGTGKSSLAGQFALEGVQRGEYVLYLATDSPAYHVRHALQRLGCAVDDAERAGLLTVLDVADSDDDGLDPRDPDVLLYTLFRRVGVAPRPMRLIVDSLWPLASALTAHDFVDLIQRKNLLLRRSDVTLFDTKLSGTLDAVHSSRLLNTYDTVLELNRPHDANGASSSPRMLRFLKVRGVDAELRPFPFTVSPTTGVVVAPIGNDARNEERE
jgi:circadian clock protein KaiC